MGKIKLGGIAAVSAALLVLAAAAPDRFNSAVCSRPSTLSPWDQYVCKVLTGPKVMTQCVPARRTPVNARAALGLVVLFHGYSGCPDAFDPLADALQAKGFHVLSPLLPGHGRVYKDCTQGPTCIGGYSVEGVPTKRQGYVEEVSKFNTIIQAEAARLGINPATHIIGAFGLSLGSPTAFLATAEAPNFWNRLMITNPFFGISDAGIDNQVLNCDANTRPCVEAFAKNIVTALRDQFAKTNGDLPQIFEDNQIQNSTQGVADLLQYYFRLRYEQKPLIARFQELQSALRFAATWGIENPLNVPKKVSDFFEGDFGWGDECENARLQRSRGGFCQFKVKHLFAAHSFGQYALGRAADIKAEMAAMLVERDGLTRNSLAFEGAQVSSAVSKLPSQICVFRVRPNCEITVESGNTCGVPHSMFSRSEQSGNKPFTLYWENYLISQIVDYFSLSGSARKPLGTAAFNNDPAICHRQDVNRPEPKLITSVPGQLTMSFNLPSSTSVLEFERIAIQNLTDTIGAEASFVVNSLFAGRNFASPGAKMVLELPKPLIDRIMGAVRDGKLTSVEGAPISSVESPGKGTVVPPTRRI